MDPLEPPEFEPPGWLPVVDAFNLLGRAKFKKKWTGNELYARSQGKRNSRSLMNERLRRKSQLPDHPPPAFAPHQAEGTSKGQAIVITPAGPEFVEHVGPNGETPDELFGGNVAEHAARRRFEVVWNRFRSMGYSGEIEAATLDADTGDLHSLKKRRWGAEDVVEMLRTGRADEGKVFVRKDNLDRAIRLGAARNSNEGGGQTASVVPAQSEGEPETNKLATTALRAHVGRPTLSADIIAAYDELKNKGSINFADPKKRLYEPIRRIVRLKLKSSFAKGLGNETIRGVISSRFDEDAQQQTS